MTTVTLSHKSSIDSQVRLVRIPSQHEPEELFRNRPRVNRVLSLEDTDRAQSCNALPVMRFDQRFAQTNGVQLLRETEEPCTADCGRQQRSSLRATPD